MFTNPIGIQPDLVPGRLGVTSLSKNVCLERRRTALIWESEDLSLIQPNDATGSYQRDWSVTNSGSSFTRARTITTAPDYHAATAAIGPTHAARR